MTRIFGVLALVGAFLLAAVAVDVSSAQQQEKKKGGLSEKAFQKIDKDGNMKVSKAEFKDYLESRIEKAKNDKQKENFTKSMPRMLEAFSKADASMEGLTFEQLQKVMSQPGKKKKAADQ